MFWAAIWKSAGKPLNTTLHQIMKRSRNLYHFQVKKVLKAQNEIKKSTLLNCLGETNGDTDICSEIKKLRRAPLQQHLLLTATHQELETTLQGFIKIFTIQLETKKKL